MKQLNKKTLLILAIIGLMVLIGDFVLYFGMGVISWKTFDITASISGVLAIISTVLYFYIPNETETPLKDSRVARGGWFSRTRESSLFEAASALIVIITWAIAIATDKVELEAPIGSTAIVVLLLFRAYYKRRSTFSLRTSANKKYNLQQQLICSRIERIMAVVTALAGLLAVCPGVNTKVLLVVYAVLVLLLEIGGDFLVAKYK